MEDMGVSRLIDDLKRASLIPYFCKVSEHFAEYADYLRYDVKGKNGTFVVFRPVLGMGSSDGLTLLAFALVLRRFLGYEPIFVFDDAPDSLLWEEDLYAGRLKGYPFVHITYRKYCYARLLDKLKIKYYTFSDIPSIGDFDKVTLTKSAYWEDYWARVSSFRLYRLPVLNTMPKKVQDAYKRRRKQFIYVRRKLYGLLSVESPVFFLLWHGDLPFGGDTLISTYLNLINIPFLFVKRGIYDDTVQIRWDATFSSPHEHFFSLWQSDEVWLELFREYWEQRISHRVRDTSYGFSNTRMIVEDIRRKADGRRIILAFPNVMWDGSVYTAFRFVTPFEWLKRLIKFAGKQKNEVFLVIRMHPHESIYYEKARTYYVLKKLISNIPENVMILPPDVNLSTYQLMQDLSEAVYTVYNGTVGLEFPVLQGKKAVLAGRAHYSNKGFTIDANNWQEYEELLLSDTIYDRNEVRNLAEKYSTYYFVFSQLLFPIVRNRKESEWYVMFPGVLRDVEFYDRWDWYLERIPYLISNKVAKELPIY